MDPSKLKSLSLGEGELFVHDRGDLLDYDRFFEFVLGNGEMMGRVDALHSQHLRNGAKKDVMCVRLVDLWGEKTYPIHRGRPGGRFISRLGHPGGRAVEVADLTRYAQRLDPGRSVLHTEYSWRTGEGGGENRSSGFMSKTRTHLMAHRYVDTVDGTGWTRSFRVETVFPYHSRASTFSFKKPYNSKRWAWGEVEHENEIEPENNAAASYDAASSRGLISFSTEFVPLRTRVVWVLVPWPAPDAWSLDPAFGSLSFTWNLVPGSPHVATVLAVVMTDRDDADPDSRALEELEQARSLGYERLEEEHGEWWRRELGKSCVSIPDRRLQTLYDASMCYLLNNVGGSYWGFVGVDNVIYETCLCDNMITLHALVETNHLEEARRELELLDRYLPAARKNAADRMRLVLGIESSEAALLPFYLTEDGIELWQDNVFGMYTSMSAFHSLALMKTYAYTADEAFLRDHAFPWLRAYAEYGRLHAAWDQARAAYIYPLVNVGGGGEGYWYRVTMSQKLYYRMFAHSTPLFRYSDLPPLEFLPLEELSRLTPNWIDAVLNFRWIMENAARLAELLGTDTEARAAWRDVASRLLVPHDERTYLSNIGADAEPSIGGPAVGGLFWPAEGVFEDLDAQKVERTFQEVARRRHRAGLLKERGRAWDGVTGLSYAYMGRGEDALAHLEAYGPAADTRGIEMRETIDHQNYYYLLNHGSFVLLTRSMLLQTYRGRIRLFPAVPEEWRRRGVSCSGLPAEGGYLVSAGTGPEGSRLSITDRSGRPLLKVSGAFRCLDIVPEGLDIAGGPVRLRLQGTGGVSGELLSVTLDGATPGRMYSITCGNQTREARAEGGLTFTTTPPVDIHVAAADARQAP